MVSRTFGFAALLAGAVSCTTPRPEPASSPPRITLEEVATYPRPGTSIPRSFTFSPDDNLVTFLDSPDDSLTRSLFAMSVEDGRRFQLVDTRGAADTEENLSVEEKLRRERRRETGLGVTRYAWAEDRGRLLIPIQNGLYVQDGVGAPLRNVLTSAGLPVLDPRLSPDGDEVAYVQGGDLHVLSLSGGKPRRLTHGGPEGTTRGLPEFIAQEEMGRFEGYWWSPDGQQIAFAEVDETHIPVYRIVHQGTDEVTHEDHRYPFAGADNARVKLGVVASRGGPVRWMDLGKAEYLAKVHWMPGGDLLAEVENRAQTELKLLRFDLNTGKSTTVLTETSDTWINLRDHFHALDTNEGDLAGAFIWGSERSGFQHLYLIDSEGRTLRPLTQGEWVVDSLEGVDEERGLVYFTGTKDGPTQRHLYSVPLEGGRPTRVTEEPGVHFVELDHGFRNFVDVHSRTSSAPSVTLRSLDGGKRLLDVHLPENYPALKPPELVTLQAADGATLYGAIYKPDGPGPFPTIVSVYGGPGVQRVTDGWWLTADLRAQYLRERGFLVFKLDNRGSSRRGVAFESPIRHDLGNVEIEDQVLGVQWLVDQGLTDPNRVGIYGWSYGGYMAALALGRAPGVFKAAVAGAPATSWDGYDTHYTERYMGTPESNPGGYARSSVMANVPEQTGTLLLIHGMLDENVHFRHTARLIQSLIDHDKDYEVLLYPNERHLPRKQEDRESMEKRVSEFFRTHL